ncbi:MAG: response regulator [Planctomycetota bacterium]
MPLDRDVLTTGEVARICNVAPRTVSKWFDSGQLKGYRIPGSKDRRIPVSELTRFMQAHGIPTDILSTGETRVLIADDESEIVETLARILREQTSYAIETATTSFAAGIACERHKPSVVLIDVHLDGGDAKDVARIIRSGESGARTRLIGMSGRLTDGQAQSLRLAGFDAFLKKPFPIRQAIEMIEDIGRMAA